MKQVKTLLRRAKPYVGVAKFLYQNRKVEIALVASLLSLARQVYQIATGH